MRDQISNHGEIERALKMRVGLNKGVNLNLTFFNALDIKILKTKLKVCLDFQLFPEYDPGVQNL